MDKNVIERACRNAGMTPERRETIKGHDVFVADGFAAQPHVTFKRFGVEPGEFPWGCFATIWWTAQGEERFDVGAPLLFNAFHDPQYDAATKKKARINTALREATGYLTRRGRIRLDG